MRLIHYTLRNLFVPIGLLFAAWGFVFYLLILHEVEDETNDTLANYKEIIIRSALSDSTMLRDHTHTDIMTRYQIREVTAEEARLDQDLFYDTTVYIEIEQEDEPVRALRTYFMSKDHRYYELILEISTLEQEDMIETMVWGMTALYVLMLSCILLIIHRGFNRSFRPLYRLLDWLRNFRVGKPNEPLDNPTRIDEFRILNEAVRESSLQNERLYDRQKQFVENAAHELQTPLAICMNKLEMLSERSDCTEGQLREIGGLHQALGGIIRLNKTLLLLSRIENRQFPDTVPVCLNRLVRRIADDIGEIYEERSITLRIEERGELRQEMNESLATTLVTNLVKNAYVHNRDGGRIEITVEPRRLTLASSGMGQPLEPDSLFTRFSRQTNKKESTGLGLAIVKSIADRYHIRVDYRFEGGLHQFSLFFP